MITGAHSIIYSKSPDVDRAFLRDVLELPNVDVGDGWLIFGLPPAEVAVHPSDENDVHEFYLICDDVEALVAEMRRREIACAPVRNLGWGLLTQVTLPGGGQLGVYQPRHARPKSVRLRARRRVRPKAGRRRATSRRASGGRKKARAKAKAARRNRTRSARRRRR